MVVPKVRQSEMLEIIQKGHLGITKSSRRAREAALWHGMSMQ